jgi:putative hydrolase of the HAD superfamily
MLPVRLAAPDLTSHLVFGHDSRWTGPTLRSLTDLLPLVDSEGAKQRRLARTLSA